MTSLRRGAVTLCVGGGGEETVVSAGETEARAVVFSQLALLALHPTQRALDITPNLITLLKCTSTARAIAHRCPVAYLKNPVFSQSLVEKHTFAL